VANPNLQVVIRLFEDRSDPSRFNCELFMSPGSGPYVTLCRSVGCEQLLACLSAAIDLSKSTKDGQTSKDEVAQDDSLLQRDGITVGELDGTSDKWERPIGTKEISSSSDSAFKSTKKSKKLT